MTLVSKQNKARSTTESSNSSQRFDPQTAKELPPRFDERTLAAWWGISVKTLQSWRSLGLGPPYIKFRNGMVRYSREQIIRFEIEAAKAPVNAAGFEKEPK